MFHFGISFHDFHPFLIFFLCRYSVTISKSIISGGRIVIILGDKVVWVIIVNTEVDIIHLEDKQNKSHKKLCYTLFPAVLWLESFCRLSSQAPFSAQRGHLYQLSQCDDCYSLPRAKLVVIKPSRLEHSDVICVTGCLRCLCTVSTLSKWISVWGPQ